MCEAKRLLHYVFVTAVQMHQGQLPFDILCSVPPIPLFGYVTLLEGYVHASFLSQTSIDDGWSSGEMRQDVLEGFSYIFLSRLKYCAVPRGVANGSRGFRPRVLGHLSSF